MVMANENVWVADNIVRDNPTAPFMVIAYTQEYNDPRYNPYPRNVVIGDNLVDEGAKNPDIPGADMLLAAFGGALPPIMWDGLSQEGAAPALAVSGDIAGWSLNLTKQGQSLAEARPSPLSVPAEGVKWEVSTIGAPAELEERIR
jgi:hypothetical protein